MIPLDVVHRTFPGGHVVSVCGELHRFTVDTLDQAMRRVTFEPGAHLVLDLSETAFCDSSGVAALLAARNHVVAVAGRIALAGGSSSLVRTLRVLGLATILPTYPTTEAATAALRGVAADQA